MNKVLLVGRLTKDVEVQYTTGEKATAYGRFSVAINRRFKNSEGNYDADFVNCVAFGKQIEFISKYFHKGDMIGLEGRITTGNYTDKEGNKRFTTEVTVENVEFVGGKGSGTGTSTAGNVSSKDDFMAIPDGDEEPFPWDK